MVGTDDTAVVTNFVPWERDISYFIYYGRFYNFWGFSRNIVFGKPIKKYFGNRKNLKIRYIVSL